MQILEIYASLSLSLSWLPASVSLRFVIDLINYENIQISLSLFGINKTNKTKNILCKLNTVFILIGKTNKNLTNFKLHMKLSRNCILLYFIYYSYAFCPLTYVKCLFL